MYTKQLFIFFSIILFSFRISAQEKPAFDFGGAIRMNYNYSTWKQGQKDRGGDFGYDVFYLDAAGKYKGVKFDAEYRLYSKSFGGGFLKRAWVGYDFSEKSDLQVGLTKVPFGIASNSHNWFFGLNYYMGFEDDHDMGIKYSYAGDRWTFGLGFFKNAEELDFGSDTDVSDSRYAYDVGSFTGADGQPAYRNKEVNQLSGTLNYLIGKGEVKQSIGLSGQLGGLYNIDTRDMGHHRAFAVHYTLDIDRWDVKAQWTNYAYHTKAPDGESREVFAMTAYGAPYLVASKANIYTLAAAYSLPVHWGPISSVVFYNDFGVLDKQNEAFTNSFMNVTGASFTAGNFIAYLDFAAGKNQPWLGPDWDNGLGAGNPDADWSARLNLNLGYYF